MMKLSDFPIYFDGTQVFKPDKWDRTNNPVRKKYVTEAGTDQTDTIRSEKWTISCEFSCTSDWEAFFEGISIRGSVSVKSYEPRAKGYVTRTMSVEDFSATFVDHSENIKKSVGLYTVSFKLVEV